MSLTSSFHISIAVISVIFVASLTAQPAHWMFAGLNLTAEQQKKMKALNNELLEQRNKNVQSIKVIRDKMKVELLKEVTSTSILLGYTAELGDLHKQLNTARVEHLLKVKKLLTPEQFAKILEKEERIEMKNKPGPAESGYRCPIGNKIHGDNSSNDTIN